MTEPHCASSNQCGTASTHIVVAVPRFGQFMGRRRNWKKAYVSLKPGQEINFAAEV